MKNKKVHTYLLIGIILISNFSYAQKINSIEENSLKFQTHFFEALKQKAIKNYTKAIENLEKCYEIDSLNSAVHFEFSKNYFLLENYFEAKYFIDKALEIENQNIFLLTHEVNILRAQRNFKKAIEIQQKIIEINPKYSDKLVLLYIQNKDFNKAEQLIVEIEEKVLSTKRIKGFKLYLENRKKIGKAISKKAIFTAENLDIETLKKGYNKNKEYKLLQKILNKEEENKLFEALYVDSKNGLELFPAQPYLYKMNGLALNNLGKYNEAIDVLTLGIDFVIDNVTLEADFYELLSISYEGIMKHNEALKFKKKAQDLRNKTE